MGNISSTPDGPSPRERVRARRVQPRADLRHLTHAGDVTLTPDAERDDVIHARFWNGDEACYGAAARVTETVSAVSVEVVTGVLPEAEGRPCRAIAVFQELEVVLAAPLGTRSLRSI
jgi:hypothetical protein